MLVRPTAFGNREKQSKELGMGDFLFTVSEVAARLCRGGLDGLEQLMW